MASPNHGCVAQHEKHVQEAIQKIVGMLKNYQTSEYGTLEEELMIVDAIQRAGLDHYFNGEINLVLQRQYEKWQQGEDDDLHVTGLRFRLLRHHGYNVSPDVFKKFKNDDGKFKEELGKDLKGLLSLFEACQLSVPGEDILDEAIEFSEQLLRASLNNNIIHQPKASMIEHSLNNPSHKSLAVRFSDKNLLSVDLLHASIDKKELIDEVLKLMEIDFKMAQMSWSEEISQVSKWGEDLNSAKNLGFARIRPIRWYMWSIGIIPYPNMKELRIELTKAISLIYIIDDIFDIHGTLDELSRFTQVVNRWEHGDTGLLPDYMKVCVKTLYDFVDDFSLKIHKKHGWNPKYSLMKTWVDLCNAYLTEAKWFAWKETPSAKEYLKIGMVTFGIHVVMMHTFFFLGQNVNQKTVDEMNGFPPIVSAIATIARLWNDVGTYQYPNHAGNDSSYIDCYINEHEGCSAAIARQQVAKMIKDAWKCLNQEYFSSTSPFSANFKEACLNFARMVSIMYNRDAKGRQSLEKLLNSLLNGRPN